jgi:hypothetical protein
MKRNSIVLSALAAGALLMASLQSVHADANQDPANFAHEFEIRDSEVLSHTTQSLTGAAEPAPPVRHAAATGASKMSPLAAKWAAERPGAERDRFVVNFQDDVVIPRFPEPAPEPRDSEANRAALDRAAQLVRDLQARRAPGYERLASELGSLDAKVLETFWLIKAAVVEMPVGRVAELARRDDVVDVTTDATRDRAPNNNSNDDAEDGRARIASDVYLAHGYGGSTLLTGVGLLDTGMRFKHDMLNLIGGTQADCVNGGADCLSGSKLDPEDHCDHGTSSGAIISGDSTLGSQYHGVTGEWKAAFVDSWKVYPGVPDEQGWCYLDSSAALIAFEQSVARLDRLIVAEMQASDNYVGPIPDAANAAFDAGAVVIAANGNNGPGAGTVNAPANASKVIGVGAFDVQTQATESYQSLGPTSDMRTKPDIQAPTNTETASSLSDSALHVFGGTSGSTPYAAGAAVVTRNFLVSWKAYDPGQVYAQLILAGQHPCPCDNTSGAGRLVLPAHGKLKVGQVYVKDGMKFDIPFDLSGSKFTSEKARVDAALWWPEQGNQFWHSQLRLELIDPNGAVKATSADMWSVFQRAQAKYPLKAGMWTLRITGAKVASGTQQVYFAAFATEQ